MGTIKIATMNLESGVSNTKGFLNYITTSWKYFFPHSDTPLYSAGNFMKDHRLDIALLTEISERSLRTGFESQIEIISKFSNLINNVFFPSQNLGKIYHDGNGIVSRYSIISSMCHKLPRGITKRSMGEAIVRVGSQNLNVFVAHLSLGKRARARQIKTITSILKQKTGHIVLGGDFNSYDMRIFNDFMKETGLKMHALRTFPSWNPNRSLDYIFLSKDLSLVRESVFPSEHFSDHLPLVSSIRINENKPLNTFSSNITEL